jgi:hypothetical protein
MPVWAFEPEGGSEDVLVSLARLWGSDLFVEALRVEDDDHPEPVPSVRERFGRWVDAAGGGRARLSASAERQEGDIGRPAGTPSCSIFFPGGSENWWYGVYRKEPAA